MQYILFKWTITKFEDLCSKNIFTDHGMGWAGAIALPSASGEEDF